MNLSRKNGKKSFAISIVILVEAIALMLVASYAWVETVSSIKITTEANKLLEVDTYVFTEAMIGEGKGTIDLADYFKKSGDMHLAPASSADGNTLFFPKMTANGAAYQTGTGSFRKGDYSDKNTAYLSVSFKLRADVNADFFFTQVPTFSQQGNNIRVSVTAYTEGMSEGDLYNENGTPKFTKIYANSDSTSSTKVVGNTAGTNVSTSYEAFSKHIKGKGSTGKLFSVAADETKIVTINLWLQGSSLNNSLPQNISISNFGIISDLTPRHVTLIPTDRWDLSGTTEYFYAWCWDSSKSGVQDRLYKLKLDENEHYSFDYNGTYRKTLFIRCGNPNLTTESMKSSWSTLSLWNKTADTAIPDKPVDPTFVIYTINGGTHDDDINANKSTGAWVSPDLVTIKTDFVTGQSSWGNLTSASYYGTSVTSTQQVEANNSSDSNAKHHDTIHALPGKKVRLNATPTNQNYAFVGWYDNPAGTGTALSTSATYDFNASSEAPKEVVYYAKFKEIRKLTIVKYLDGSATNTTTAKDVGTITIGSYTSANDDVTSYSQTYDKGTSVTFSAEASPGYTLDEIYTTTTGSTKATSPLTLNDNTTYYAKFTTNRYNVTANVIDSGGTVKAGSSAAGATSTASVKYKSSVNVVATAASGYDFDGWYSAASGGTFLSADTTYTVDVSTIGDKQVYAKFKEQTSTTIYMTYRGYSHMRVYVYGKTTNRKYNGDFPGTTIPTYTGNRGLYSYTFKTGQDEDIGIIVSDNGSDTVREEFTAHIGETVLIGPPGSSINRSFTLGTKRYVYFTKNWTNNYIHYWGASSGNTTWPGNNMNSNVAYKNEYNQDVLYYVITTNHTKVIFHNNSGTQTGDTTLGNNSCFYFNKANEAASTWPPPTN